MAKVSRRSLSEQRSQGTRSKMAVLEALVIPCFLTGTDSNRTIPLALPCLLVLAICNSTMGRLFKRIGPRALSTVGHPMVTVAAIGIALAATGMHNWQRQPRQRWHASLSRGEVLGFRQEETARRVR